ncbi:MAG: FliA/WhiG family RNA polymerase sigma factor [Deltaproteobacteria bacterium]|nr:FliA/WhiG family RNA polymerase sigma factor [Deltaproteobacteria bacterium]
MSETGAETFTLSDEELVRDYLPLIQRLAYRLASRLPENVEADDLINSGVIGLLDAVGKFDPGRNIRFRTYAEFRIRGAMLDDLRSQDWASRGLRNDCNQQETAYATLERRLGRPAEDDEVAASLDLSLEEFHQLLGRTRGISLVHFEDLNAAGADSARNPLELIPLVEDNDPYVLLQDLEARRLLEEAVAALDDRDRLVLHLYYYEELNLKEVGLVLDVSESRVCQMRTQAIIRLRNKIKNLRRRKISAKS